MWNSNYFIKRLTHVQFLIVYRENVCRWYLLQSCDQISDAITNLSYVTIVHFIDTPLSHCTWLNPSFILSGTDFLGNYNILHKY